MCLNGSHDNPNIHVHVVASHVSYLGLLIINEVLFYFGFKKTYKDLEIFNTH